MPDGSIASALSQEDLWHRRLSAFNAARFTPGLPYQGWREDMVAHAALAQEEGDWLEVKRAEVADRAAQAPRDPDGFVAWFEQLEHVGPGPRRHAVPLAG